MFSAICVATLAGVLMFSSLVATWRPPGCPILALASCLVVAHPLFVHTQGHGTFDTQGHGTWRVSARLPCRPGSSGVSPSHSHIVLGKDDTWARVCKAQRVF